MATIEGLNELSLKLKKLSDGLGVKAMKDAANVAMDKTFLEVKTGAPVGKKPHRTYKGRLVAPGYLKRTLKKSSRADRRRGKATVSIKAAPEAFYGVQFLDRGTKKIPARRWFADKFFKNRRQIESTFASELRKKVKTLIR